MAKGHLSNDEFFSQLTALIHSTQQAGHGSVYLTQKRLTFDLNSPSSPSNTATKIANDPLWDLHPPHPLPLLVRATDGKSTKKDMKTKNKDKKKISTVVQPDDIEAFFARYADVCKAGMQSLKKRDRSKRKKDKKKGKGGAAAAAAAAEGNKKA